LDAQYTRRRSPSKVELPARLNDLLEQFKVLKGISKTEMITFALEDLLRLQDPPDPDRF